MSEAQDFRYIGQRTIRPDGHDKGHWEGKLCSRPRITWNDLGKILRSPPPTL